MLVLKKNHPEKEKGQRSEVIKRIPVRPERDVEPFFEQKVTAFDWVNALVHCVSLSGFTHAGSRADCSHSHIVQVILPGEHNQRKTNRP